MYKNESGKTLIMWSDLLREIHITGGSQKTSKIRPPKKQTKKDINFKMAAQCSK